VIELKRDVDADELWQALGETGVLRQMRRLGREYGKGLWKIEPGDLFVCGSNLRTLSARAVGFNRAEGR